MVKRRARGEQKSRSFFNYISGSLMELADKYGIKQSDYARLQEEMEEAEECFLDDTFADVAKVAQTKRELGVAPSKKDLLEVLVACRQLVRRMMKLKLDWPDDLLKKVSKITAGPGMFSKGDSQQPFYSECFLYNLLGKDDARSVLYRMEELARLLGVEE